MCMNLQKIADHKAEEKINNSGATWEKIENFAKSGIPYWDAKFVAFAKEIFVEVLPEGRRAMEYEQYLKIFETIFQGYVTSPEILAFYYFLPCANFLIFLSREFEFRKLEYFHIFHFFFASPFLNS